MEKAELKAKLADVSYSDFTRLSSFLNKATPILLVIPAIWIGGTQINDQFKDYLDQGADLFIKLKSNKFAVKLFVLGAEHKGEGFLHQKGKDYLTQKFHIAVDAFVWEDERFRKVGLCSVEEAELLRVYLDSNTNFKYQIITIISKSQLGRYYLHHQGFGIESLYYVFPDKEIYFHKLNEKYERLLLKITLMDPCWKSETGIKLRNLAGSLRSPEGAGVSPAEAQEMLKLLTQIH